MTAGPTLTVLAAPTAEATLEASAEVTPEAPIEVVDEEGAASGITTLMLLLGIGAVLLVGGLALLRENAPRG